MSDSSSRIEALSPERRALLQLLLKEKRREDTRPSVTISKRETSEPPLSFSQERMWFLDQLEPANPFYNMTVAVRLSGRLNVGALKDTLNELIRRHESLRTSFSSVKGNPLQVIAPQLQIDLPVTDLSDLSEMEREAVAREMASDQANRPFDLATLPLVRARLLSFTGNDHILLINLHHIIFDGWSAGVLVREVASLYPSFCSGFPSPLPPLPIQYADFALWQRHSLSGHSLDLLLDFWHHRLADAPPLLLLPTDRPRLPFPSLAGSRLPFSLPNDLSVSLKALSHKEGATLFITLLAAFKLLLHLYSHQDDVLVGTRIAGRTRLETEPLIGFFVNALVLRTDLSGNPSFRQILARVRDSALSAYSHQELPFEELVKHLQPERSLAHSPLFNVMFALQNAPFPRLRLPDLEIAPLRMDSSTSKYDLDFTLWEEGGGLRGWIEYSTELFSEKSMAELASRFERLVECVLADPDIKIDSLDLMSDDDRQLIDEFNNTRAGYPSGFTLSELFQQQAALSPDATALICSEQSLSFSSLNQRANQLAHHLIALGVGPEVPVALFLNRSIDFILSLIAILKAGGVYIPIDPSLPSSLISDMLSISNPSIIISDTALASVLPDYPASLVLLDRDHLLISQSPIDNPQPRACADNLSHIVFSSGSTGLPKPIAVSHHQLLNRCSWMHSLLPFSSSDLLAQRSSASFSVSLWEFFGPLLAGSPALIIPDLVAKDLDLLVESLSVNKATRITVVPSLLRALLDSDIDLAARLPHLRLWSVCGEPLSPDLANLFHDSLPEATLINQYGASEVNDIAFYFTPPYTEDCTSVPLGRPVQNTRIYLLDDSLQIVPPGIPGNLFVSTPGLARCYLNQADLTAERFIPDPFSSIPGARLYDSRDRAKLTMEGLLEYAGRTDHQVKVRGMSVDLKGIESVIKQQPEIKDAAVVARQDKPGLLSIVAYVVAKEGSSVTASQVKRQVAERMAGYCVPEAVVKLKQMPLTASGKLDRRSLPEQEQVVEAGESISQSAASAVEQVLEAIWCDVLGVEEVGRETSFFDLGGHSLLATKLISRVKQVFHVEMGLRSVFESPTIRGLGEKIEAAIGGGRSPEQEAIRRAGRDEQLPLSFAQQRLWFLDQLGSANSTYNTPTPVRLSGRLNVGALEDTLEEIIHRHEALRTSFISVEGSPVQIITDEINFPLPLVDLSALPEENKESIARKLASEDAARPFSLSHPPLIRSSLIILSDLHHLLLLTMHHIISDGWSAGVLVREVASLYPSFCSGSPSPLPPLPIQYADFALWQRHSLSGHSLDLLLDFWHHRLADAPPLLLLPTDRPRLPFPSLAGSRLPFSLPNDLSISLKALSHKEGATLFITLLAAFKLLLHLYSHQDDILVGTRIAGRTRLETEPLIGFFVNALVLRTDLSGNPSFRQILARVRDSALSAYSHQELPFEELVKHLQPERSLAHSPLFNVMFALQNAPFPRLRLPDLEIAPLRMDSSTSKYDLDFTLWEEGGGLRGWIEYSTELFSNKSMAEFAARFERLVECVLADPDIKIDSLDLMSDDDRQLIDEFNDTQADYPSGFTLSEIFQQQAALSPDATALICSEQSLSFSSLNQRANQLAHHLISLGVGPEIPVALFLNRSIDFILSLIAILKAGGVYIPIDPSLPSSLISDMLSISNPSIIISDTALSSALPDFSAQILLLDRDHLLISQSPIDNPLPRACADNLSHIVFSSGSTGLPKPIAVSHHQLLNRCSWMLNLLPFSSSDLLAQRSSASFSVSLWEFFGPLLAGSTALIIPDLVAKDLDLLVESLSVNKATRITVVPSLLRALLDSDIDLAARLPHLLLWSVCGEPLSPDLANLFHDSLPEATLINQYGASEVNDIAFYFTPPYTEDCTSVPLGRPVQNTRIYLLDDSLQIVPPGIPGNLFVSTPGLARCYLNQADLTAERFIPDPFSSLPGARLYDSRDRAKLTLEGVLEYAGRTDHQVKVRGMSVDLKGIESVIKQQPEIKDAAVVARQDKPGLLSIVAYVVAKEGSSVTAAQVKRQVAERMAGYCVPEAVVKLKQMPLTASGKLDRRSLPEQEQVVEAGGSITQSAASAVEQVLEAIWCDVLGVEEVGRETSFFDLGGHSLLATKLISRVNKTFRIEIPLSRLFERPTVAEMESVLIEHETKPGQVHKIAHAMLKIRGMSVDERKQMLQKKRNEEGEL